MPTKAPKPNHSPLAAARLLRPAIIACFLLGAGCEQAGPRGQVVAVVNGEEITTAALNEEAKARNILDAARPAVRAALLQDLVDRKLLAQKAIEQKLDRSPRHLVAVEGMKEVLLAQDLLGWAGMSGAPHRADFCDISRPIPWRSSAGPSSRSNRSPSPLFRSGIASKAEGCGDAWRNRCAVDAGRPATRALVKTWDSAIIPEQQSGA
jgi:hypothetical protein